MIFFTVQQMLSVSNKQGTALALPSGALGLPREEGKVTVTAEPEEKRGNTTWDRGEGPRRVTGESGGLGREHWPCPQGEDVSWEEAAHVEEVAVSVDSEESRCG